MTRPRLYRAVGWSLALIAAVAVAVAAAEILLLGYPRPASFATALLLAGTAIAWPFVSGAKQLPGALPTCRECGRAAWGFNEFHFCIHCGSTRVPNAA